MELQRSQSQLEVGSQEIQGMMDYGISLESLDQSAQEVDSKIQIARQALDQVELDSIDAINTCISNLKDSNLSDRKIKSYTKSLEGLKEKLTKGGAKDDTYKYRKTVLEAHKKMHTIQGKVGENETADLKGKLAQVEEDIAALDRGISAVKAQVNIIVNMDMLATQPLASDAGVKKAAKQILKMEVKDSKKMSLGELSAHKSKLLALSSEANEAIKLHLSQVQSHTSELDGKIEDKHNWFTQKAGSIAPFLTSRLTKNNRSVVKHHEKVMATTASHGAEKARNVALHDLKSALKKEGGLEAFKTGLEQKIVETEKKEQQALENLAALKRDNHALLDKNTEAMSPQELKQRFDLDREIASVEKLLVQKEKETLVALRGVQKLANEADPKVQAKAVSQATKASDKELRSLAKSQKRRDVRYDQSLKDYIATADCIQAITNLEQYSQAKESNDGTIKKPQQGAALGRWQSYEKNLYDLNQEAKRAQKFLKKKLF